jgi:hypothetical protein
MSFDFVFAILGFQGWTPPLEYAAGGGVGVAKKGHVNIDCIAKLDPLNPNLKPSTKFQLWICFLVTRDLLCYCQVWAESITLQISQFYHPASGSLCVSIA